MDKCIIWVMGARSQSAIMCPVIQSLYLASK